MKGCEYAVTDVPNSSDHSSVGMAVAPAVAAVGANAKVVTVLSRTAPVDGEVGGCDEIIIKAIFARL